MQLLSHIDKRSDHNNDDDDKSLINKISPFRNIIMIMSISQPRQCVCAIWNNTSILRMIANQENAYFCVYFFVRIVCVCLSS